MGNKRLTPEKALEIYKNENRGHLKIFIGYAPGVGKTYTMLNEGNRRLKYGEDIVIGYVESHNRKDTDDQLGNMEIIKRKIINYEKMQLEEMDLEAIIARNPKTVLIDELAHTNIPGSKNKKRYQDVEEILSQGINVITTLNVQHLDSLSDIIYQITKIKVRETIPDKIVQEANEVVVIDLTPDALQNRLLRGKIYDLRKVSQSLNNFFRKGNLNALREITLRQIAEEVDEDLEEYLEKEGINDNWQIAERIMVCISPNTSAKKLIRRGARIAKRYKCEWYVVYVNCNSRFVKKSSLRDKQILNSHYKLANQLGAEIVILEGKSVSGELAKWANEKNITQIIIGYPKRSMIDVLLRGSTINKLIKKAKCSDIRLIRDK